MYGKFKYGPYIIADKAYVEQKERIIAAVEEANDGSPVLQFMEKKLE